ncbi:MAG: hypothetical protein HKL86_03395 [Acidimicrobiaceae bacterium]|nr:hypothetical protein [Acidimicrobiaceae bacterium]
MTTPLVIGLIIGQRSYGTLVALGSLWGVSQDGLDRWRIRAPRLQGVAIASGVGVVVGSEFVTLVSSPWALIALLGVVAFVAGVIEASLWSSAGMYVLLGTIIGGGLGFAGRTWQAALAISLGVLWVYAVASLTDRRSRLLDQRSSLFHAFRALANLLEGADTVQLEALRSRAVVVLDTAQDVIGTEQVDAHDDEMVALYQGFVVALQLGELSSYLASKGEAVEARVAEALRDIGAVIRYESGRGGLAQIDRYRESFADDEALVAGAFLAAALRYPDPAQLKDVRTFRSTIYRLPMFDRLRFAVLLSGAILVAAVISHLLEGPKGYWLPMSVAFILRPDLGPVVRRAVARTIGTLAGVGIAALIALLGNPEILLIVLCCAMAASVPLAAQRSHALTVMVFTPIVFVFIGVLGSDQNLFVPRIVDTVIAAVIVLFIDFVLWLHAPSLRPRQLVEQANVATLNYQRTTPQSDAVTRHSLRRNALRVVTRARASIEQAQAEPHLFGARDPSLADRLDLLIGLIDLHTLELIEGA